MKTLSWLTLLFLSILGALPSSVLPAQTDPGQFFYVRSEATGAATGRDWTNAYTGLPPVPLRGAVYYVADGSYGAVDLDTPVAGSAQIVIKKATAADHGTDVGWDPSMGDGWAQWASVTFSTSHWLFDGVRGGGPGDWLGAYGFRFSSPAGTSVDYVTIANGVSNITVRHASFTQSGDTETTTARANAIYNAGTVDDSLFEYLHVDNIGGLPFFLRGGRRNVFQFVWTGNICGMSVKDVNQHCEAMVIHDMDDLDFRWNYIGESPSSGGFVKNNSQVSEAVRIYGNVFRRGFPIQCNTGTCLDWTVTNNTFATGVAGPIGAAGTWIGLRNYNNLMYGGTANPILGAHGSNWYSDISSNSCSMNSVPSENVCVRCAAGCDRITETRNPFVDDAKGEPEGFSINNGLVAVLRGADLCPLIACDATHPYDVDMLGRRRGGSNGWTVGALQFVTVPKAPTSLRVVP